MLVNSCVDFRFVDPLIEWLRALGLRGEYDLRTHEGCALTVDQWVQSDAAMDRLHDVEAVWIVDHEDCGAYKLRDTSNTRENHVQNLLVAQARIQAWLGKPTRIFSPSPGPDGVGAAAQEEIRA